MKEITLFMYPDPDGNHYRAVIEPGQIIGDAWPLRRYIEDGKPLLDAVVIIPGIDGTSTYRFEYIGNNWTTKGKPIAHVSAVDLIVGV